MNSLELTLLRFLNTHLKDSKPLLVAFSGGPDSFTLVRLLQECQKKIAFQFELAHLDHRYRKTSSLEASQLENWAKEQKLIFHLDKIDQPFPKTSCENFFRQKRYQFFLKLWSEKKYQALLFGHHQNDLEETTLKRMLEGAAIENLNPLKAVSTYEQIPVWRPLIEYSKDQILKWATDHQVDYIIDTTNFDQSNLRSRLRLSTIPLIEKDLGKNVRTSLSSLAKQSEMLLDFLESRLINAPQANETFFGYSWNLKGQNFHLYEWRFWVKRELKKINIHLSRNEHLTLSEWINGRLESKRMQLKSGLLYLKDQQLVLICKPLPTLPLEPLPIHLGSYKWGIWQVDIQEVNIDIKPKLGWLHLLSVKPTLFLQIPFNEDLLENKQQLYLSSKPIKTDSKRLKVLSSLIPQVWQNQKLNGDFANPKQRLKSAKSFLNITLTYKMD